MDGFGGFLKQLFPAFSFACHIITSGKAREAHLRPAPRTAECTRHFPGEFVVELGNSGVRRCR